MQPGDEALIVKLKYRLQDPTQKGKFVPSDEDYEFGLLRWDRYVREILLPLGDDHAGRRDNLSRLRNKAVQVRHDSLRKI